MKQYKGLSRKRTGVSAFEIGDDFILVEFNNTSTYKYSYKSCGKKAVEKMKMLALASKGLSTFIAQNKPAYEWKN